MSFNFHPTASAQQLADVLPHGLAILDQDFALVFENYTFPTLVPPSSATFQDRWLQSIHQDDISRANASFNKFAECEAALRVEYRIRDQNTWRVLTLNPLLDKGRDFGLHDNGGFIATVVDITPEKRAEYSQRQLAKDAEEHKRLQERFIDMVSHEIRNPLSAILHCTEDIMEAAREEEPLTLSRIKESAGTISLCISHQKKILDDVLTFSKIDASMLNLSPRSVEPKSFFKTPISLFRPQLQRNNIQFDYQSDLSYTGCGIEWVMADLDRMSQVLINLLSNAIKFTAKSKKTRRIRVSIGASKDRPSSYPPNVVFFRSSEAALNLDKTTSTGWGDGEYAYIMLAVKDTGIGIDDHAQIRLFERFNQATPKTEGIYGGSGLGLNVSRKLCHLHGGEIGVSSKEGQGSTFGFFFRVRKTVGHRGDSTDISHSSEVDELARHIQTLGMESYGDKGLKPDVRIPNDPPVGQIDELSRDTPPDERTKHTKELSWKADTLIAENFPRRNDMRSILIVEDNIINRTILTRKLRSLGFQTIEANNGLEALDALERRIPDCILMDQEMPLMDGNAATKHIRELEKGSNKHVPIIGVTANARSAQKSEMLQAGMDDVIHKPFYTDDIVAKINQFIPTKLETTGS